MNRITTTILTVALSATPYLASAATPIESSPRQMQVSYGDLNLGTTEGAAVFYRRLHGAAEAVCDEHGTKDMMSFIRVKACVSVAVSAAVTRVNRPLLTAYHRAKLGQGPVAVQQAAR